LFALSSKIDELGHKFFPTVKSLAQRYYDLSLFCIACFGVENHDYGGGGPFRRCCMSLFIWGTENRASCLNGSGSVFGSQRDANKGSAKLWN
jgi:hypothetical protein